MPGFDAEPAALVQADSGYLIFKTSLIMTQAKMPHFFLNCLVADRMFSITNFTCCMKGL